MPLVCIEDELYAAGRKAHAWRCGGTFALLKNLITIITSKHVVSTPPLGQTLPGIVDIDNHPWCDCAVNVLEVLEEPVVLRAAKSVVHIGAEDDVVRWANVD